MKNMKWYLSIVTVLVGLLWGGQGAQAFPQVITVEYDFNVQFFAKKVTEICPQAPQEAPADLCAGEIQSCRDFAKEKLFKYFGLLESSCELTNPHGGEWKCNQQGFDDLTHFVGVLKEGKFDAHGVAQECLDKAAALPPKEDVVTGEGNTASGGSNSGPTGGEAPTQGGGSSVAGAGFMVQSGSGCSLTTQAPASSVSSYWTIWVCLNLIHFYRRIRQKR